MWRSQQPEAKRGARKLQSRRRSASTVLAALLGHGGLPLVATSRPNAADRSQAAMLTTEESQLPLPSLLWMAPVLADGGYSSEAMSYALALRPKYAAAAATRGDLEDCLGLRQFAEPESSSFVQGLPEGGRRELMKLIEAGRTWPRHHTLPWDVVVCHATPDYWHEDGAFGWGASAPCPPTGTRYRVGRTMYETDRLPATWVPRINEMDEVWVPSKFAVEQFAASGIQREKIVVVPEAVDTDLFDPAAHEPLASVAKDGEGPEVFRFLSVFKWEPRKGWDVLLRAYFEEFSAKDPVRLLLKTSKFHGGSDFEAQVASYAAGLPSARRPFARYTVLGTQLPLVELPKLYRAADAFVLPSRGEGWGRPHVEAMSMALPVIATNWSGPTEFLSDQWSLPLKVEALRPVSIGDNHEEHRWAEPSVPHLRQLLRWVAEHRSEGQALGKRARQEVVKRSGPEVIASTQLLPQLRRIQAVLNRSSGGRGPARESRIRGRSRRELLSSSLSVTS